MCVVAEINSLILGFLFWEKYQLLTFSFSKLIGIVDSSGQLNKCELCFEVLLEKTFLNWWLFVYFGFVVW